MDWQPIETAPKDNKPLLLYSKYEGVGLAIWWRNRWHWWADGAAIEGQSDFGTDYKEFSCPSHWTPLPPPPASADSSP